ncbi:MAG: tetratricopeptide repeat protein [Candidatus Sulfotelmatobacter sp.]
MLRILASVLLASALAQAQASSDIARSNDEAERGDARAQFWLGAAYERGKGIEQDFGQALKWLMESAKRGSADAQNLLGQMYEDAEGVPQDYRQAAKWYRAACEHRPDYGGAGQGCNNLGLLYLDGKGVKRNSVEAYKYFRLANNGVNLGTAKRRMTKVGIVDAKQRTERWIEAHPDQ